MANVPKPMREPSSPPLPTQSDILGVTRLSRRLFRIPKQQKDLLDRPDSWAQVLSRKQKPGVNVPPEVLENLRSFHKAQVQAANPSSAEDEQIDLVRDQPASERLAQTAKSEQDDDNEVGEEEVDEEGPGTPVTDWSISPQPQRQIDTVQAVSPEQRFASQSPEPDRHSETMQPFISQLPARSPLRPTLDASNLQTRQAFDDFPSSSLEVEEELEMIAPAALTKHIPAVNKAAELMPTPPSAQVQVPSTYYDPNSSVVKPQPKKRDGYPTAATVFKRAAELMTAFAPSVTTGRMAPPKPAPRTGIWDSQSTVYSSSSVIPATNVELPRDSPVRRLEALPMKSPTQESPVAIPATLADDQLPRRPSPEYRPASPGLRHPSPEIRPLSPQVGPSLPLVPNPEPLAPFIAYSLSYPSYIGSSGDFVKACLYIEILQRRRALASYQYDDFIRAWVHGYLPYIENLGGSEPRTLTAIEWYMETVEEQLFSANIVTKQNLNSVLALYPDEVRSARSSLGLSQEQSPDLATRRGIQQETNSKSPLSREKTPPQQNIVECLPASRDVTEHRGTELPKALSPSTRRDESQNPSAHPTPSRTERQANTAHPPSTPVPKIVSQKRPVAQDHYDQTAKRQAVERVALSDNGTPRSTGYYAGVNPKRQGEDLEKRSRRLKKFLARDKSRGNSGVASSALGTTTPTSGQKD
jgi:hypothetical protein